MFLLLGSWLLTNPDPTIAALWGTDQQMKDLSLPLYLCLSVNKVEGGEAGRGEPELVIALETKHPLLSGRYEDQLHQ